MASVKPGYEEGKKVRLWRAGRVKAMSRLLKFAGGESPSFASKSRSHAAMWALCVISRHFCRNRPLALADRVV